MINFSQFQLLPSASKANAKPRLAKPSVVFAGSFPALSGRALSDTVSFSKKPAAPKFGHYISILPSARGAYDAAVAGATQVPETLADRLFEKQLLQAACSPRANDDDDDGVTGEKQMTWELVLANNMINLDGPVTDQMAAMFEQRAKLLISAMQQTGKVKPITLYVNSPGGSILAMNKILDVMDAIKTTEIKVKAPESGSASDGGKETTKSVSPVLETICLGYAASAASVIMSNGTPGHRYISPRSRIMIHQPLGGAHGQATDIELENKLIQRMKDQIHEHFMRTTKVLDTTKAEGRADLRKTIEALRPQLSSIPGTDSIIFPTTDNQWDNPKNLDDLVQHLRKAAPKLASGLMTDQELKRVMERDYWMEADECLALGFVDKVASQFKAIKAPSGLKAVTDTAGA
ncbi:MAG: ATP-dependent Clp protease proteolytic subunit [Cyanobacteria bacterium]|nr:ATP-dependent Clp protease proteolytic subunit [Cyanobacteriota bacterium]